MTRKRDSQRKKFWLAFNTVNSAQSPMGGIATQMFVDEVTKTRWWKNRREDIDWIAVNTRTLRSSVGVVQKDAVYGWRVTLPKGTTKLRALASVCHSLHDKDTAWHGPEYCRVLLEATEKFIDKETADALRAEFKTQRVKLRSWSPEAREAARFRHARKELEALRDELSS